MANKEHALGYVTYRQPRRWLLDGDLVASGKGYSVYLL